MANPTDVQQLVINITGDAKELIAELKTLQKSGMDAQSVFDEVAAHIVAMSGATGLSIKTVSDLYSQLIEKAKLFGVEGEKGALGTANAMREVQVSVKETTDQFQTMEEQSTRGFNFINTALGTMEAMLIFQVLNAITTTFTSAIQYANEYYQALLNITIAQDTLARNGIAVTNQQLLAMATDLSQQFQTFANVDMVKAVSQAALLSNGLGLSVEQIKQLAEMAAILARENGGLPADYVDNLIKAAEGTKALWANGQQIAITNTEIVAKAKELGLVTQDTKTITDEHIIAVAGLAIEYDRLGKELAKIQDQNGSILEQQQSATANLKNGLTALGQLLTPLIAAGQQFLGLLGSGLQFWAAILREVIIPLMSDWLGLWVAMDIVVGNLLQGKIVNVATVLKQAIGDIREQLQSITGPTGGIPLTNTPTGTPSTGRGGETAPILKSSSLDSILKDVQTYQNGINKATTDFNNQMKDKQDEYNLSVEKETAGFDLRVAEEKQNFRLKQLQEEQNFQQKMKDMQSRYLMDLEDALRKRDAEAVIKIMEKYNLDKDTAQQQEALKQQQDKQNEQIRLQQMRAEEQLRLKEMQAAYELQKSQDERNYELQINTLRTALDQKLQEEAVSIGQENHMNTQGIDALYALFKEFYGPDGKLVTSQGDAYISMLKQSDVFVSDMITIIQQYANTLTALVNTTNAGLGSTSTVPNISGTGKIGGHTASRTGFATGGAALAQSATTATFGEAGPELALFLPLNGGISGGGKFEGFGGGSGGGLLHILLDINPDLEARIIDNALNQASLTIQQVYRSRG